MQENKNNNSTKKSYIPGACRFCGYITPFDPDAPGFCCPVCGAQSGTAKADGEKTHRNN